MDVKQIAERIAAASPGARYSGPLSDYAVSSILSARSNYPVSNLLAYCLGAGLRLVLTDLATEDRLRPSTVLEVHKALALLMERYGADYKLVYRKTGAWYTAPKTLEEDEMEKMMGDPGGPRHPAPLSVKTLIAVCDTVHCDIGFEPVDESSSQQKQREQ